MFFIREENPEDIQGISETNRKAFGQEAEVKLVETLRVREELILSLVGVLDNQIIGFIGFSEVKVRNEEKQSRVVACLAPMAIVPEYQQQGYGAKLIAQGLESLKERGYSAVVVLGYPDYYPRFGFVPSIDYGITCSYECPDEAFMIKVLRPGVFDGTHGVAHFCSSFAVL